VNFKEEIRRISAYLPSLDMQMLNAIISSLFPELDSVGNWRVTYKDDEGDNITVNSFLLFLSLTFVAVNE